MTDTSTKPTIKTDWSPPAKPAPPPKPDLGPYSPDLPIETELPAAKLEPGHAQIAAEMSKLLDIVRGVRFVWLTAHTTPEAPPTVVSEHHRPDLYPAILLARQCLEAITTETETGPRRTYLQDGAWHVEVGPRPRNR